MECLALIKGLSPPEATILAAVAGVAVAVLAWLLKSLAEAVAWYAARRVKAVELVYALRAEIQSNLDGERPYAEPATIDRLLAAIDANRQRGLDYVPYSPTSRSGLVYEAVRPDITALPRSVIAPFVHYYNLSLGLTDALADFRSDAFKAMDADRRKAALRQIGLVGQAAVAAGEQALDDARRAIARYRLLALFAGLVAAGLLFAIFEGVSSLRGACPAPTPGQTGGMIGFRLMAGLGSISSLSYSVTGLGN